MQLFHMPLKITALDDDVLRQVALYVLVSGDAYWFCASCRAFRAAMHSACKASKTVTWTALSTAFQSHVMLMKALSVPKSRLQIIGNPAAANFDALIESFDKKHRWQARAITHAFRIAPFGLLDYIAPQWRVNKHSRPLQYAAAAGRITILDEIMAQHPSDLVNVINTFSKRQASRSYLLVNVVGPAVMYGETKTLQWLINRLSRIAPDGEWRESFGNVSTRHIGSFSYNMLLDAVQSPHAALMLSFIVGSLIPQAMQVTGLTLSKLNESLLAIVLAMMAGNEKANVNAWRWLRQITTSAHDVWTSIELLGDARQGLFSSNRRIDSRRVFNSLICSESESVYRWQLSETGRNGWLYEIIMPELFGLPRPRPLSLNSSIALLKGTHVYLSYATFVSERGRHVTGDLYKAARVDVLLSSPLLHDTHKYALSTANYGDELPAMCDSLTEFFSRIDELESDDERTLQWVEEYLLPMIVLQMVRLGDETDWERVGQCLRARSVGGYGACGASFPLELKRGITMAVSLQGPAHLVPLLHAAVLYAPFSTLRDKDVLIDQ